MKEVMCYVNMLNIHSKNGTKDAPGNSIPLTSLDYSISIQQHALEEKTMLQ